MRLFRDCNSTGQTLQTDNVIIGIYNSSNLSLFTSATLKFQEPLSVIKFDPNTIPCLTNAPSVCFQIGIFTGQVELPSSPNGYTLSWIRCCRADNIANLSVPTGIGATFVTNIPGTSTLASGHNSSPQFAVKDAALVCQNKSFVLDFGATDPDSDSLSYSFCDAYSGGTTFNPDPGATAAGVPATLPLNTLPYRAPFSGSSPLGAGVSINPKNGQITGLAPAMGRYVINVCVAEWRSGKVINIHHKDFILQIGNCDFAAAIPLPLSSSWCKDYSVHFSNNSTSSTILSYQWDFGVKGTTNDTSSQPSPVYTYADTGLYTIKLTVKGAAGCSNEDSTTIGVYPGFKPDFTVSGSCFQTPFNFKDESTTKYGSVNSWRWNFGDSSTTSDTSVIQNPSYKYVNKGTKIVSLIASTTKGCIDTVTKPVVVNDFARINLPFRDTLICAKDTLPIHVPGSGTFSWSPGYNIINSNSANPLVFPKDSTTYIVTVNDTSGCTSKDSVRVNVIKSITVYAGADTNICRTDSFTLHTVSNAIKYQWTPSDQVSNANIKNPVVKPDVTTTYLVTASVGSCVATDDIKVKVAPLPIANAGRDVTICYGDRTQLAANISGSSYSWAPAGSLLNSGTLTPVAIPTSTTNYVLTVRDTLGCNRAVSDSILVSVVPHIKAFAGNDTSIVANQPLQLNASGGSVYVWTPSVGMNNPFIPNPVVTLNASYDSVTYVVKVGVPAGCFVNDTLQVKVFKTTPDIFIPTAFTPNGDGKNDILKPIPVGISTLNYFRIYNRWGQLVYSTSSIGRGWDGTLDGKEQPTGTYVYMAQGTNYLGRSIAKKGTVVLIR